jgi:hypothetical protein
MASHTSDTQNILDCFRVRHPIHSNSVHADQSYLLLQYGTMEVVRAAFSAVRLRKLIFDLGVSL